MVNVPKDPYSRRRFLVETSSLLAAVGATGCGRKSPTDPKSSTQPAPLAPPWPREVHPSPDAPPRPELGPLPQHCAMVVKMTQGPCTTQSVLERADISEGWPGLPLLLTLRLVNRECQALPQARVRIWHTNHEGSYSGQTPANDFCLFKKAYASQNFFRGEQISDAQGIVQFSSCYPGWYPGRAVHIHLQVFRDETESRSTQLYFPSALNEAVFRTHPQYVKHGMPDTPNKDDNIFNRANAEEKQALTLEIRRDAQRNVLAYKTLCVLKA